MVIKSKKWWKISLAVLLVLVVAGIVASVFWYNSQLSPVDEKNDAKVRIHIKEGTSAGAIIDELASKKVIRSAPAASIYLRINGTGKGFQTGVYSVSPSQSVPEIVQHLTSGRADEKSIMLYPGAMLHDKSGKPENQRTDVFAVLKDAGYSEAGINRAFSANYRGSVLADKPKDSSLEGYIYGETYFVATDATPEQIIQRAIDEFSMIVEKNDLKAKFAKRGLTLYQGITLASIVQRESVGCRGKAVCEDQRNIAAVFYNRMKADMNLGSDVTYHYAADSKGVARDFLLDSPYNTRIHSGLPPGPIAVPGLSALNAVADPANVDYLFFLSGDDHVTYFAKTDAEHQANIRNHCHDKCLLP